MKLTDEDIAQLTAEVVKQLKPWIEREQLKALRSIQPVNEMDRPLSRAQVLRFIQERGCQPNGDGDDFL